MVLKETSILSSFSTLVELLRTRADENPDKWIYRFLAEDEGEEMKWSASELDIRARRIASVLQRKLGPGDRALLLYPPGLDYIAAFFGCLYAGVVAVPAYPPDPNRLSRTLPRLQAMIQDSQAKVVLTTDMIRQMAEFMFEQAPDLAALPWVGTDGIEGGVEAEWKLPSLSPNSLAFLQYTSGSTGVPKGVMLSHGNLLHNLKLIQGAFGVTPQSMGVSWLPPYHDMGLIGGILEPLYAGAATILMSPLDFLKKPLRWLRAVSRYRGTTSGGPNFAYEMCARKITAEEKEGLDLSSWQLAFSGAEPVRAETLDRFADAFASCGFDRRAFYPCYGLAEGTLIVSGGVKDEPPLLRSLNKKELEKHRAREAREISQDSILLVSSGRNLPDQKIAIVDPQTLKACPEEEVGEIWVKGPSVAQGYWNRPDLTREVFASFLAETKEGPFLRTGDLGFLKNGELFVTGRLKDLIIIRGNNHYPQDIEHTFEKSHPALRAGCGAAFSVEGQGEEKLVVVCECEKPDPAKPAFDPQEVFQAIRQSIAQNHEIDPDAIVLLKPGRIPKTTSGKISRNACRRAFLDKSLEALHEWKRPVSVEKKEKSSPLQGASPASSENIYPLEVIQDWISKKIGERLNLSPEQIDYDQAFTLYGLDSKDAVGFSGELEDWLGLKLVPTLLWQYPNLRSLSAYLFSAQKKGVKQPEKAASSVSIGHEPVAIVGMSCRFPQASDLESFWKLLHDGVDAITEVPPERWNVQKFYDPEPVTKGKMNSRWGGFLDKVDHFDAQFFGISPREASRMDPQQRLVLETSWEALEDAGQVPARLKGSQTGVFLGIGSHDYSHFHCGHPESMDGYVGTGNAHSIAANRLSYLFDFRGPSLAIDTACSSSLVAIHLACRSLRSGESDMALAGGVNLILRPEVTIAFSQARMMSSGGRCKTFDAEADGYVRSEGVAMVVLKRLSDAVKDGDRIWAVIRGSAVNQDGHSNGLTAPNGLAQQAVVREALKDAGLQAKDLNYLEAHGTGTPLGDPIEMQALGTVLKEGRPLEDKCWVGSVKTNIGHLEVSSGVAGLMKVVLALKNEEIPPHLHLKKVNDHIPLTTYPIAIPTERQVWKRGAKPRIAGVNSFGFGGANAHVVIEEAPASLPLAVKSETIWETLKFSAKTPNALKNWAARFAEFLKQNPEVNWRDAVYSANIGRADFEQRAALSADSAESLRQELQAFAGDEKKHSVQTASWKGQKAPKIAFLFTGQGSQYPCMGRALYESQPVFRKTLDRCDEIYRSFLKERGVSLGLSAFDEKLTRGELGLLSILYGEKEREPWIHETGFTQPALFAVEYALSELWRSWGVVPDAVLGHSVGEYVAACVAGVFNLEEGLSLIAERAALMQSLPKNGAMLAVAAEEDKVARYLAAHPREVSLAAVNAPRSVVVSGLRERVEAIQKGLEAEGVHSQLLQVSHAFHSPLMDPILARFEERAAQIRYRAPRLLLPSNLTGQFLKEAPTAEYWRKHLREAVRFCAGVQRLAEEGFELFVEAGPQPVLSALGKHSVAPKKLAWLPSMKADDEKGRTLFESAGALYLKGVELRWKGFAEEGARRKISLPTYPFERERYWLEVGEKSAEENFKHSRRSLSLHHAAHPLLGERIPSALKEVQFETTLDLSSLRYLHDHRVSGETVLPATAYVEMALAAAREASGRDSVKLTGLEFKKALFLDEAAFPTLQVILNPQSATDFEFQILSLSEKSGDKSPEWILHCTGSLLALPPNGKDGSATPFVKEEAVARFENSLEGAVFYENLKKHGLEYGPAFQGVKKLWRKEGEALGEVELPESLRGVDSKYGVHPALLDACLQVFGGTLGEDASGPYLPVGMETVWFHQAPENRLWCHAFLQETDGALGLLQGDLYLYNDRGNLVAEILGLRLSPLEGSPASRAQDAVQEAASWFYDWTWELKPREISSLPSASTSLTWIVFMDEGGLGESLKKAAQDRGEAFFPIYSAGTFSALNGSGFEVNAERIEDFEKCLSSIREIRKIDALKVAYLWGAEAPSSDVSWEFVQKSQRRWGAGALHAAQALIRSFPATPISTGWVTRGAQNAGSETAKNFASAALWGFVRTLQVEHPELHPFLIDLSASVGLIELQAFAEEFLAPRKENQVSLRGGQRFVPILSRSSAFAASAFVEKKCGPHDPFRLEIAQAGTLEGLKLRGCSTETVGGQEIEIEVSASGLNFSDVMKAMGLYPGLPPGPVPLGIECAGKISRVGQEVKDFKVGDEVIAIAPFCFGRFVKTHPLLAVRKPKALSFEEAATIPITFLTAAYALQYLGRMQKGERVLIHAAAGGVGLAAIQLARQAGAEVFATAGSPEKREFVRSLGVNHVFDSRTFGFVEEIRNLTQGKGVDLVLNSLSGEFIPKSLSLLGAFGRFLEIGKTDIYQNSRVGLKPFQDNLSYFAIDLDRMIRQKPEAIHRLFAELMQQFERGSLKPLPLKSFPIEEAQNAFRYMAQRKNIGKVVVTVSSRPIMVEEVAGDALPVRADAAYLITGGWGGLGLKVASFLVDSGARSIALVGRSEPSPDAKLFIKDLEAKGAVLRLFKADLSKKEEVSRVLSQVQETLPPLKGILHAAGILQDGFLLNQKWENFEKVIGPKAGGAHHLHELTRGRPLDFFILFSSVVSALGSPGQSNYGAANAQLDALAALRNSQGLPALSIHWGPWGEVGMAARSQNPAAMAQSGFKLLPSKGGLAALEKAMKEGRKGEVLVASIDWQKFRQWYPAEAASPVSALFEEASSGQNPEESEATGESLKEKLLSLSTEERPKALHDHILNKVALVLSIEPSRLDPEQPLNTVGLDSLMAIELKNEIETHLGVTLSMATLIRGPSIKDLTAHLLSQLENPVSPSTGAGASPLSTVAPVTAES
ncbi:MAG: SDR family NAD(P)-dependent oxidoreductase [bacterium]